MIILEITEGIYVKFAIGNFTLMLGYLGWNREIETLT
jgi:hypothetical protein